MIEKLRKKISLIILFAISIPLLFTIILYNISYSNNIIRTNARLVDRFFGEPDRNININYQNNISEIDGIYSISISNGVIIKSSNNITDEIKEYALKISNKKSDNGIVGNFIYNKRYFLS